MVPVEFADPEGADRALQLVTVSRYLPYLDKKDVNGGSAIVHDLKDTLCLGPLWIGWTYDASHELKGIR